MSLRHLLLHGIVSVLVALTCPSYAQIVINEIMYDPPGNPDVEYVELINAGAVAQDLTGWYLLDDIDTHDKCFLEGTLQPGEYLVVAGRLELFNAKYPGVTNVNPNPFQGDLPGEGFILGDGGDQVRLFSQASILIDTVLYDDTWPWPTEPDGDGPSLELYHPSLDNSLPYSWAASVNPPPEGTPGSQNSVYTTDQPPVITTVSRDIPLPTSSDSVTVVSHVTDGVGLSSVELMVDTGAGFVPRLMFDDGLHGDNIAGDSLFGVSIEPQASGTLVRYYVLATDVGSQAATLPVGAPQNYLAYTVDHERPQLRINEILAVNMTGIVDEMGITEDWLEIYNYGPDPVSLAGMFLSNNFAQSLEWQLPDMVLEPGEFVLVWCDDDDAEGPLHTNFKLSKSGSEIALFDTVDHGNVMIHGFRFGLQSADVSFGYYPDDSDSPEYLVSPTPAASNNTSSLFSPICINEFQTTSAAGGVDDWVELHNRGNTLVDLTGWYLSDEADEPFKFQFPAGVFIAPGGYLSIDESILLFGFTSDGQEVIMLTFSDGTTGQDYFDYGPQQPDVSQGRMPNGTANWHFFTLTSRGLSNTCAGVPPLGPVTDLIFTSRTAMSWAPGPGAEAYDIVSGDLATLRSTDGDFSAAMTGCFLNNEELTVAWNPSLPATGQGLFYVVRGVDFSCGFGTYDTGSASQHAGRDSGIAAAGGVCP